MATSDSLVRTPFYFMARRRYREAELRAYICREHRAGRALAEILNDPYIDRCGGQSVLRGVLRRPDVVRALGQAVEESIVACRPDRAR